MKSYICPTDKKLGIKFTQTDINRLLSFIEGLASKTKGGEPKYIYGWNGATNLLYTFLKTSRDESERGRAVRPRFQASFFDEGAQPIRVEPGSISTWSRLVSEAEDNIMRDTGTTVTTLGEEETEE